VWRGFVGGGLDRRQATGRGQQFGHVGRKCQAGCTEVDELGGVGRFDHADGSASVVVVADQAHAGSCYLGSER